MSDPAPVTAPTQPPAQTPETAPTSAAANDNKLREMPLKELDPRIQRQIDQADKAIEKNPAYAMEICSGILANYPGCLDIRKILHKAQKKANPAKAKGFGGGFFKSMTNTPFVMKAGSLLKTDPKAALDAAEKLLSASPANMQALGLLGQAAATLGLWNTAVFAYDSARELEPDNIKNMMSLSTALIEAGQPKEAIKWGERILELTPGDGDAQAMLRRASVAITMDKGKWDEQSDFRQKLANKEQAVELEQQARMANDSETLSALVVKMGEAIDKDPENINLYRDVIGYLKQLHRYDDALAWVRRARQQPLGRADTTLEKLESDMTVAQMRGKIDQLAADVATTPDAAKQAELDSLRKNELEFRLLQAKGLVDKYPNDFGFRFDYGDLLLQTGQSDLAIRELQLARRNPKVSQRAMLLLGRAYRIKGILDLAVEQLVSAKTEMNIMNELKKEIIYELASVYRKQGQVEKAVEEYKIIYANDIDYRDVSKIINEYYEKRTLS
jgi:tetratricopeptide (TPR) repeat protein